MIAGAQTLPADAFTSRSTYRQEQDRIFSRLWFCAGREEETASPGDFITREMGGESLLIVRDQQNQLRAFYNVCRHRGARLVDEERGCDIKGLTCPYHGWRYGLDGALRSAPLIEVSEDFDPLDYPLVPVAVETWMGFIFLCLEDSPSEFSQQLEGFPDVSRYRLAELRCGARQVYEVNANWKLLSENYGECYHCAVAHPQLQRVSDFRSGGTSRSGPFFTGGPMELRPGFNTMSLTGVSSLPDISGLTEEDHRYVYYYNLYPNFLLSLHPDYAMSHILWPKGASRTRVVCEWLFTEQALARDSFDASDVVDFWHLTNSQDWGLCESVQQGARSRGFRPGPYQSIEASVYNFDQWYRQTMTG